MKTILLSFIILFSVFQNIICKEVSNDVILQKIENIIEMQKMMYETTNKRFELVDKRFEQVDKHFVIIRKEMNQRFEEVDKRINLLMWFIGIIAGLGTAAITYLYKSLQTEIRKITILETDIKDNIKNTDNHLLKTKVDSILKYFEKEGKIIQLSS